MGIFDTIFNRGAENVREQIFEKLSRFRIYINGLEKIRVYVESQPTGTGHVANTCKLIQRLIEDEANGGMNYKGTVEVVMEDSLDDTRITMGSWFPVLYGTETQPSYEVNGATMTLRLISSISDSDILEFGMTGGMNPKIKTMIGKLHVQYFLRVEPFLWGLDDMIVATVGPEPGIFNLDIDDEENHTAFSQRAFYYTLCTNPLWEEIKENCPNEKFKIEAVRQLVELKENNGFWIMPVYAFNNSFKSHWIPWMTHLLGSILWAQKELPSKARAVVLVDLSELYKDSKVLNLNFWDVMEQILTGKDCDDDKDVFQRIKYKGTEAGITNRKEFFEHLGASGRFFKIFPVLSDEESLRDLITQIENYTQKNNNVIFLNLGRLPANIFEYLMCKADLPSFFEGANTANNALLTSKPFFRDKVLGGGDDYPSAVLNESFKAKAEKIEEIVRNFHAPITGYESATENPNTRIGKFLVEFIKGDESQDQDTKEILDYFKNLGDAYNRSENDKFSQGIFAFMAYLESIRPVTDRCKPGFGGDARPVTANGASDVLDEWQRTLESRLVMGTETKLPEVMPQHTEEAMESLLGSQAQSIVLVPSRLTREREGTQDRLVLTASTDSILSDGVAGREAELVYTMEGNGSDIRVRATFRFADREMSLPGVAWIVLKNPGLLLEMSDYAGRETVSEAIGEWSGAHGSRLDLALSQPLCSGTWLLSASLREPYPSAEDFYAMIGGVNPISSLPGALRVISNIRLSRFLLQYSGKSLMPDAAGLVLQYGEKITLGKGVELDGLQLLCSVLDPGNADSRSIFLRLDSVFSIGSGEDAAKVEVQALFPDFRISGRLKEGRLVLSDLWNQFLSFIPNPLSGSEAIDTLDFSYDTESGEMLLDVGLGLDWELMQGFTLENVSLGVSYDGQNWSGEFDALLALFTEDSVLISAGCSYDGAGGWSVYASMQEGSLKIGKLITSFLGWSLPQKYDYGLKNVRVQANITQKHYSFYGETDGIWAVPFLPDTDISNVTASVAWGSSIDTSVFLKGDVDFFGIALQVLLNYKKDSTYFQIKWNALTATVAKTGQAWKAELSLSGQTLGGMVEHFVSWVTGDAYALPAPWSILNNVSLSAFKLVFEFPEDKAKSADVYFDVAIGPIDMGFAKIESVSLQYVAKGAGKGVRIGLIGSFLWQSDAITVSDDGSQKLEWDPTKPEDAPAPDGAGNSYFDLRLLAMGHHVQLKGAQKFDSVQQAVDALKVLHAPEDGKLPVGPGGPLEYNRESGWLIGADFGILRTKEGTGKAASYFLSMAAIFNDPLLYGLHVKLDGDAAKIFKGLEFDIMYRKVTDTLGCYSARITLPERMRRLELGVLAVTLPSFYFEVYTNGDFYVDAGFPHNQDFTKSFALEAVVPPGIPVTGAAGFYFGKLSSQTAPGLVPAATNGWFNPVITFGLGVNMGIGKSIHAGILTAGFSVTVFGIIEGVIARWLPYAGQGETNPEQIQDTYYFSIRGSMGLTGRLYGTVDFAIIKAEVNVLVSLSVDIAYASYEPIPITVMAVVDVRLSLKLSLGIFSINIHLSFSLQVKETFVIENHGEAPWHVDATGSGMLYNRRKRMAAMVGNRLCRMADAYQFCPGNLKASDSGTLQLYMVPALSIWGDEAESPAEQKVCYIPLFSIQSSNPVSGESAGDVLRESARRAQDDAEDDFERMAERLVLWLVAAGIGPMDVQTAQDTIVSEAYLKGMEEYLADPDKTMPLLPADITTFLSANFTIDICLPTDTEGEQPAVVFPAIPDLTLCTGAQGGDAWRFADYNQVTEEYLGFLKEYFSRLAVKVQEESGSGETKREDGDTYSIASYVYADYFLMLAKQMVRAMLDGLRSFLYQPGTNSSMEEVCADISRESGTEYPAAQLLDANADKELSTGLTLLIGTDTCVTEAGDTLRSIAQAHGMEPGAFADHKENLQIHGLFTYADDPCLCVPHLPSYRVSGLLEEAVRSRAVQKAGAMASRFLLHGLRLPQNEQFQLCRETGDQPDPCAEVGLYAAMGQQVMVPEDYALGDCLFSLAKDGLDWVTFNGGSEERLHYEPCREDYRIMSAVYSYAASTRFCQDISQVQFREPSILTPGEFSLGEASAWSAGIVLPHGSGDGSRLKIWELPGEFCAMLKADGSYAAPSVYPVKVRFDEAEGKAVGTDVANYGIGTKVELRLKTTDAENCYEIMGAGSSDAALLERMVTQVQSEDAAGSIYLLYESDGSYASGRNPMLGVSQTNLSTVTRPDLLADAAAQLDASSQGGLLNNKRQFIRILWEAAITRNGGFYLHYYDADKEQSLPDALFDDRGEGKVSIVILQPASGGPYDLARPYSNVLATDVPVQNETMSLCVYPRQIELKPGAGDCLESMALACYTSPGCLADQNKDAALCAGAEVLIENGIYCVGNREPGRLLGNIAQWFGTTEEALLLENPQWNGWQGELPVYAPLRLPEIRLTIQEGAGWSIGKAAGYYGISIEQFAESNRSVKGLFGSGCTLTAQTGPFQQSLLIPASTAGMCVTCSVPQEPSAGMEDKEYAKCYLQKQYHILGYSIAENADFSASTAGIPSSPSSTVPKAGGLRTGRLRQPEPLQAGQTWEYGLDIAYGDFVKQKGDAGDSLYQGMHCILQMDLHWQDVFGNRICSDLEDTEGETLWNRRPQMTGYTDALRGLTGWPYVTAVYRLDGQAELLVQFSFDGDSLKGESPDSQKLLQAYGAYEKIWTQLNDPNSIRISVTCTLVPDTDSLLTDAQRESLKKWVAGILAYLQSLLNSSTDADAPDTLVLRISLDASSLNTENIFLLKTTFGIYRKHQLAIPGAGWTEELWKAEAEILPDTGEGNGGSAGFAAQLYQSIYTASGAMMEAMRGIDRQNGDSDREEMWVARLGTESTDGIRICADSRPVAYYAPAPLSRNLVSLENVPIYDYQEETGIDFTKPSRMQSFSDVDLDAWLLETLEGLDATLSPAFCLAALLVDTQYGTSYMDSLLQSKQSLAKMLQHSALPVFSDEHPDERWQEEIKKTYYQEILEKLSNACEVRTLLQIPLQVCADSCESIAPRALGDLTGSGLEGIRITSPKLALAQTGQDSPALLQAAVSGNESNDKTHQQTEAYYNVRYLEHQIEDTPGIEGYQRSSWLYFMRDHTDEEWPLQVKLPSMDIPFVVRGYPSLPSLQEQNASAAANPYKEDLFERSCLWDYTFAYQGQLYLQDTVYAEVVFNKDASCQNAYGDLGTDFYAALAQFVTVYPKLSDAFANLLPSICNMQAEKAQMDKAEKALRGYSQMVGLLTRQAEGRMQSGMGEDAIEIDFMVLQRECSGIYEVALRPSGTLPNQVRLGIQIDGWDSQAQGEEGVFRFRNADGEYLTAEEAVKIAGRKLVLSNLHAADFQSAIASIYLKRNENLVEGRETAPQFIYQTPKASFQNFVQPALTCGVPVNIADIGGSHRKCALTEHLKAMLDAIRTNEDSTTLKLCVSYSYEANASLGARVSLPAALIPGGMGNQDMAQKAASACSRKISTCNPDGKKARLDMEVTMISALTDNPTPILQFTNVYLDLADLEEENK